MEYVSSRGEAPALDFSGVLLTGLARDGGLYVPKAFPRMSADRIAALAGASYQDLALAVMGPFVGGAVDDGTFASMIAESYAGFRHPAVTPLVQSGPDEWLLELHRGPTLAFKDLAMQPVARLMDHALAAAGRHATVICATSGDTGGAAVAAFAGRARADLFVLLPWGRISEVQRRMITTAGAANVHALAIEGTFDDCQALVKAMFADGALRDRLNLAGVNSINWARVMAQTVYYFAAALALGAPARRVSFTVPTGNFGDVLAGEVARRMGLPIDRLVIATNVNDILARTLADGRHQTAAVEATMSPSMDIQVSSNFERLVFELVGRDGAAVRRLMAGLGQSGGYTLPADALARLRAGFSAGRADEAETRAAIGAVYREQGLVIDPHTAVGVHVARAARRGGETPMVVLSTAHPAKFPDAVAAAIGVRPDLPPDFADLFEREERVTRLANDLGAVAGHIRAHARAPQDPA
jgi:threonine synthase